MSIAQYKDKNRAELWEIVQIQSEEYTTLKRELHKAKAKVKNQKVELTNLGLRDNRIAELESKLGRVQKATKNAFTCLTACDEMLMVHMDRYNDIVEAFKEQSE